MIVLAVLEALYQLARHTFGLQQPIFFRMYVSAYYVRVEFNRQEKGATLG